MSRYLLFPFLLLGLLPGLLPGLLLALLLHPMPAAAEDAFTVNHGVAQGAGGAPLALSLVLPAGRNQPAAGWPALLLIQGSGPTDRDGNQPPYLRTDLLRQIAEYLASQGIATLRYDKRGMHANNATLPDNPAEFDSFFRWENFVGDAASAFRFLAEHPGIDGKRSGILGHSEGGVIALAASSLLRATGAEPAVLVLAATPGRPLEAVVTEQLERVLAEQKATPAQTRAVMAANKRVSAAILAEGKVPADTPRSLAALYPSYAGPFLQALLPLDPTRLAREYRGPVLLLQGEADNQVSPSRDLDAMAKALAARPKPEQHTALRFAGLSHNFKRPANTEDPGLAGPLPADLLGALHDWLRQRLGTD
ncbi:alpha/beta hydrolase family protein [Ferrovibrio sp.]|uniref:alpha/beta hydrolase family protein n=1 Tax=Ferrovibrio sp. TaxID=1917215 RepID=UPI0035B0D244